MWGKGMLEKFKFHTDVEVRWAEVDTMGIVFNSHYLTYIDIAVSDYFRKGLEIDILDTTEKDTFTFVLAKSTLEFKQPAKLFDRLQVWCRTKAMRNKRFILEFVIVKEGETSPLLQAEVVYVSYSKEKNGSVPIPDFVRERIKKFEGEHVEG